MRRASLFLGVIAAAALAGALAAPAAWAQSAVNPGGPVGGGGGAGASPGFVLPAGALGSTGAVSTSTGFRLFGGLAATYPIGPVITQGVVATPTAGVDARIDAQVTSGAGATMYLHYRMAGESANSFRQVTMTTSDNTNYAGIIPAAHVGPRGIEYYLRGVQYGGVTTRPYRLATSTPQQLTVQMTNYASLSPPDAQYRLVGLSFNVSPSTVDAVFSDDLGAPDTTQWRLGRWSDALGDYQSYGDVGEIRRGRGYWLIARGNKVIDASGQSAFQDTMVGITRYTKIVLLPGWNQIANPYAFPISWSGRLAQAGVASSLWAWNGTDYASTTLLESFTGYWVENTAVTAQLLLIPCTEAILIKGEPSAGALASTPVAKADDDGWRLGLTLTAGELRDASTEIGAATEATDGIDALDYGKPPCPPGRFVALGVLASADGSRPKRLAGDFRAPSAAGWRFPLLVQGVEAGAATLRLVGADQLPAACKVALVDARTGTAYDVGGTGAIVLPHLPTPEGVRYDLVVGPEAWVDGEVGPTTNMPKRHALEASYPNPFNPLTKIAFELPAPARARLEVLDVAGRRVAVLLDEQLAGGRHVVEWNGRDARGRGVASGTYYYRLSADDFTRTRSMTLLK